MKIFKSKSILIAVLAIALGVWLLNERSGSGPRSDVKTLGNVESSNTTSAKIDTPAMTAVDETQVNDTELLESDRQEPRSLQSALDEFAHAIKSDPNVSAEQTEMAALIIAELEKKVERDENPGL